MSATLRVLVFSATCALLFAAWKIAAQSHADAGAVADLNRQLGDLRFDNVPLEQVVTTLAKRSAVLIEVNWNSLYKIRITRATPITLHLYNASLSGALRVLVEEISPVDYGESFADFWVEDGRITFATSDEAAQLVTRAYDVWDLVKVPHNVRYAEPRNNLFGMPPPSDPIGDDRAHRVQEITNAIKQAVPDTWDQGASSPKMHEFGGDLIVVQTRARQREIQILLAQLREIDTKKKNGTATTEPVELWQVHGIRNDARRQ